MSLPAYTPHMCLALRDCGCCGAHGALACGEPPDHDGIHAFICRSCGRGRPCYN